MSGWLRVVTANSCSIALLAKLPVVAFFIAVIGLFPTKNAFSQNVSTTTSTSCPATIDLGYVGYGIAAIDPAVGEGWILWSEESLFSRFNPAPIGGNAEHLITVKNIGGRWFYDNNGGLFEFEPDDSDCLVASVNFSTDTVTLLEGSKAVVAGIDSGYESGDLTVVANQWANVPNGGEFGVSGTSLAQPADGGSTTDPTTTDPTTTDPVSPGTSTFCPASIDLGDVGYGIAAMDPAVGEGWILWSEESVFNRFNPAPIGGNAEHLIAVKNVGGQWFYDNNGGLFEFEPDDSDCLVASVNFSTDTVTLLEGSKAVVAGIDSGYESGDLTVIANQWANVTNGGEFGVGGTSLVQADDDGSTTDPTTTDPTTTDPTTTDPTTTDPVSPGTSTSCPATIDLGDVGYGIAAMDPAVGEGWILWSEESVFNRFNPAPIGGNAEHLIAVKNVGGQWFYDNNGGLFEFEPDDSDCLVASVNFSTDTVTLLEGVKAVVAGIDSGYESGDLTVVANQWANAPNGGEFGVGGTGLAQAGGVGSTTNPTTTDPTTTDPTTTDSTTTDPVSSEPSTTCPEIIELGDVGYGIAAMDPAVGEGWILWSEESVFDRFNPAPIGGNAEHLIAVRNVDGQWLYDNNGGLFEFETEDSDCLVASVNFATDTVTLLDGVKAVVEGIDSGYESGDFAVVANQWANVSNGGEFGVSGTSLVQPGGDASTTVPSASIPTIPQIDDYQLVFGDEFTGTELDENLWDTSLLWGPYHVINNEEQMYIDTLGMHSSFSHTPFTFTGETLKITASKVNASLQPPVRPAANSPLWQPNSYSEYAQKRAVGSPGDPNYDPGYDPSDIDYLSGIITSYGTFDMTHGYVEMRAKLPKGRGLWPAFWMLPQHWVEDVPEIDVMEFLGQDVDRLYNTYHYFDVENNWSLISTPSMTVSSTDWTQSFHTFGVAWSPTDIVWYVDGVERNRVSDSNYDIANQPMHLIANLAVGGNWPGAPDAQTLFPAEFEIDYIRAYKKKLSPVLDLANDYQLMFNDEFAGSSLDASKWNTHFLWGPYLPINNEEQYYVDALGSDAGGESPFSIANGVLSITAKSADDPTSFSIPENLPGINDSVWTAFPSFQNNSGYVAPGYTSGILTSYDSFKFAHGYAEIRAKIPEGDGLWPAFWLLNGYYVGPQPEIDIMEVRGENPGEIVHSYHYQAPGLVSQSFTTQHPNALSSYADGFHTYGVRWEPGKITWYVDGAAVHTIESDTVAYQVMYVIANLAVGGNFNYAATDPSLFPASFDIDYIRVYQETGN